MSFNNFPPTTDSTSITSASKVTKSKKSFFRISCRNVVIGSLAGLLLLSGTVTAKPKLKLTKTQSSYSLSMSTQKKAKASKVLSTSTSAAADDTNYEFIGDGQCLDKGLEFYPTVIYEIPSSIVDQVAWCGTKCIDCKFGKEQGFTNDSEYMFDDDGLGNDVYSVCFCHYDYEEHSSSDSSFDYEYDDDDGVCGYVQRYHGQGNGPISTSSGISENGACYSYRYTIG